MLSAEIAARSGAQHLGDRALDLSSRRMRGPRAWGRETRGRGRPQTPSRRCVARTGHAACVPESLQGTREGEQFAHVRSLRRSRRKRPALRGLLEQPLRGRRAEVLRHEEGIALRVGGQSSLMNRPAAARERSPTRTVSADGVQAPETDRCACSLPSSSAIGADVSSAAIEAQGRADGLAGERSRDSESRKASERSSAHCRSSMTSSSGASSVSRSSKSESARKHPFAFGHGRRQLRDLPTGASLQKCRSAGSYRASKRIVCSEPKRRIAARRPRRGSDPTRSGAASEAARTRRRRSRRRRPRSVRSAAHSPVTTSNPARAARCATSDARNVLPMPLSPRRSTRRPSPFAAPASSASKRSITASRPTIRGRNRYGFERTATAGRDGWCKSDASCSATTSASPIR